MKHCINRNSHTGSWTLDASIEKKNGIIAPLLKAKATGTRSDAISKWIAVFIFLVKSYAKYVKKMT